MGFQDGTRLDDETIGEVVGSARGLQKMDIAGLVGHLRETRNVYPDVFSNRETMASWAWDKYNRWLDPCAALSGQWP